MNESGERRRLASRRIDTASLDRGSSRTKAMETSEADSNASGQVSGTSVTCHASHLSGTSLPRSIHCRRPPSGVSNRIDALRCLVRLGHKCCDRVIFTWWKNRATGYSLVEATIQFWRTACVPCETCWRHENVAAFFTVPLPKGSLRHDPAALLAPSVGLYSRRAICVRMAA